MIQNTYPLTGIKVVELSTAVAAPTAARIMCSFGASVIKIETPPYGDLLRGMAAAQLHCSPGEQNPIFDLYNSGKKLLPLNLKSEKGREIMDKLLDDADVFITNVRMKSLKNMGLDYDTLKERFPRLVYGHLSGFGLEGPDANRPGFDFTAFWMRTGGSIDLIEPDAYPLRPSFGFGDITSASAFLSGILMGLIGRQTTGKGTMVSTSLFATGMWTNCASIVKTQGKNPVDFPCDRYDTWDPFSHVYRCADGRWIYFMQKNYSVDRKTFAEIFDMPELLSDPDLATLETMSTSGKSRSVAKRVEEVMLSKPAQEWQEILDSRDIANECARHFADVPADLQARANNYLTDMTYFDDAEYAMPEPPIAFSEYDRIPVQKTSPYCGDTKDILSQLGYCGDEIESMLNEKIIM